jgi:hypothetical protein
MASPSEAGETSMTNFPTPERQRIAWQRTEYGVNTEVPPSDWRPTDHLIRMRELVGAVLFRVGDALIDLSRRVRIRPPAAEDVWAGTYSGARDDIPDLDGSWREDMR